MLRQVFITRLWASSADPTKAELDGSGSEKPGRVFPPVPMPRSIPWRLNRSGIDKNFQPAAGGKGGTRHPANWRTHRHPLNLAMSYVKVKSVDRRAD